MDFTRDYRGICGGVVGWTAVRWMRNQGERHREVVVNAVACIEPGVPTLGNADVLVPGSRCQDHRLAYDPEAVTAVIPAGHSTPLRDARPLGALPGLCRVLGRNAAS
jgi:hypothetical protein